MDRRILIRNPVNALRSDRFAVAAGWNSVLLDISRHLARNGPPDFAGCSDSDGTGSARRSSESADAFSSRQNPPTVVDFAGNPPSWKWCTRSPLSTVGPSCHSRRRPIAGTHSVRSGLPNSTTITPSSATAALDLLRTLSLLKVL
jgi:hypothetical protein